MNKVRKLLFAVMLASIGMLSFASNVSATPITADFASFSVIHLGSNPAGQGDTGDWFTFDSGQALDLELSGTMIDLISPQSFSMSTGNGQVAALGILGLSLDLDDTDGFFGGTIDYILDGTSGQFTFANENYTSDFNSSSLSNGVLSLFIWGGDDANNLGIDLALTAQVPEPGVFLLMLAGFAAFRLSKRIS